MIPLIPLVQAAIARLIIGKVQEAIVEYPSRDERARALREMEALVEPKQSRNMGKRLEGKKTYIGILVMVAGYFLPELGMDEGEATKIIEAFSVGIGALVAAYGRWDAHRRAAKGGK